MESIEIDKQRKEYAQVRNLPENTTWQEIFEHDKRNGSFTSPHQYPVDWKGEPWNDDSDLG